MFVKLLKLKYERELFKYEVHTISHISKLRANNSLFASFFHCLYKICVNRTLSNVVLLVLVLGHR